MSDHIHQQESVRSGPAVVLNLQERLAYKRVLDEIGRTTAALRRRRGFTLKELSRKSTVPIRRLQQFEDGKESPHYLEMILLAPQYRCRLSKIAAQLHCVINPLGPPVQTTVPFSKALTSFEAVRAIDALSAEEQRLMTEKLCESDGYFTRFVDISINEWPAMLAPNFGESLLGEYCLLAFAKRMIASCIAGRGAPVRVFVTTPPGERSLPPGAMPFIKCGSMLDRGRRIAQEVSARLDLHIRRQLQLSSSEEMAHVMPRFDATLEYLRQVVTLVDSIVPNLTISVEESVGCVMRIDDLEHVPDMQNHPELKRVLMGLTLNLRKAMNVLEGVMKYDC